MKRQIGIKLCLVAIIGILLTGCGAGSNQMNTADSQETAASTEEQEVTSAEESQDEYGSEESEEQEVSDLEEGQADAAALEDGTYLAEFDTDSSMFHVNEACEGKGTLTVKDGEMMLHISLPSKNIVNLFPGLAEDAEKEGAVLLEPTMDTVTYSDGMTEEVHGFDVPVPVLEEEFDLALVGTKGTWYDHKVIVSEPVKVEDEAGAAMPEDGEYTINVTMAGGSGRAGIDSPAAMIVKDGCAFAQITWSSPNYDYMKIDGETYTPINTEGNSVFEIPISVFDAEMEVVADTTAMGTPHEITYTLVFCLDSAEKKS